jgi:hypothetical protein
VGCILPRVGGLGASLLVSVSEFQTTRRIPFRGVRDARARVGLLEGVVRCEEEIEDKHENQNG